MSLSIGRRRAGTALLGAVLALAAPVYAQPAARPATYNLPSLPLGDALLAGRQAGLEISFPPAAVAGKTAPALRGEYCRCSRWATCWPDPAWP